MISSEKKNIAFGAGQKKGASNNLIFQTKNIEISQELFILIYFELNEQRIKFIEKERAEQMITLALNK